MSNLVVPSQASQPLALPSVPVVVRAATLDDVPFMDSLQKLHTKQVGWMPTKQLEAKVALGQVLVAEASLTRRHGDTEASSSVEDLSVTPCLRVEELGERRVGYVISSDRYFKRDDVGIVYQVNVVPGRQRGLIGATLLQAAFDRAAYGCKLFCCWCAQDIAANHFWQSMGFVPLAYRAGSEKKARVHIFWQKRIRRGDVTTPWWFPAKTDAGAMREDRLVFPIPPGTHWSDAKPLIFPESAECKVLSAESGTGSAECKVLSAESEASATQRLAVSPGRNPHSALPLPGPRAKRRDKPIAPPAKPNPFRLNAWSFAPPPSPEPAKPARAERPKRERVKADPKLIAAARELRDRWLEHVNEHGLLLTAEAKYDVGRRQIAEARRDVPLLRDARVGMKAS